MFKVIDLCKNNPMQEEAILKAGWANWEYNSVVKVAHTVLKDMHKCLVCKAHKTCFCHCSTVIKLVVEYFVLYLIVACLAGVSQKKKKDY